MISSEEKANRIAEIADDMKAERIEVIDLRQKTSVTSYFVICTGTSDVHVNAIIDKIDERMRDQGVKSLASDVQGGGWLLLDYGDVMVHAMREERRQFYDLETLWQNKAIDPNLIVDGEV